MTSFAPTSSAEALAAVQCAVVEEAPLEILGHGSKRGIGRPAQTEHVLDLSGLTGVTLYEPEELVLSARAGTPLAEVETLLAANRQELAFEPMDYGSLLAQGAAEIQRNAALPKGLAPPRSGLGEADNLRFAGPMHVTAESSRGTIGGVLAANLSGPRRIRAGAARDHILGIHAVSGRGEAFKSGGRVVKNVTGYDMSKLLAGSWGTLAVVTDLTFKVLPAAETEATFCVRGLLDEGATALMAAAMGSSAEVSGAAHLPEGIAGAVAGGTLGGDAATVLRVEGFGPSVGARMELLAQLAGALWRARLHQHAATPALEIEQFPAELSRKLWRDIRDCIPFADGSESPVWRISVAPSEAHRMALALRVETAAEVFYDWQGGLVWLRLDGDPEAELVRGLVKAHGGGHATLVRAAPALRATVPVFQPQAPELAALSARLKEQFDPKGVLNPGRMG